MISAPKCPDCVEPARLGGVKLRFYQHLSEAEQVLARELIEEGWLYRGWLGLLEPIAWPPPPVAEVITAARVDGS
jgi:hypothetical protein